MTDASEIPATEMNDKVGVVIVAAGRGARAGQTDGPKQYQRIGDRAVIAHTLEKFLSHPRIGQVVVAIHADDRELFERAAGAVAERVLAVPAVRPARLPSGSGCWRSGRRRRQRCWCMMRCARSSMPGLSTAPSKP